MCRPIDPENNSYEKPPKGYDAKKSRKEYLIKLKKLMTTLEKGKEDEQETI